MSVLLYEKKDRIAYITLNRPEAMNSINAEMWDALTQAWIDVRDDPEVWTAIVTAAGEKAFCTGADLKEMGAVFAEAIKLGKPPTVPIPYITPMRGGLNVWKPFIAAINGIALGGGLELAMACDIRIAAEHAKMGVPEVKQGLIPGMSGTQKIPRLVPFGAAMEMLMTGDAITAQEAYRLGLVNRVVPAAELLSTAEALARKINENGPVAVRAVKESAYRGIQMSLEDGLRFESLITVAVTQTEDAMEGPRAFIEKRKPVFKGK
ncbi:MAG: enoyl-CoA hydratase-related protein [Dehalococcoidia bacterium]|nr:enoyl-CoA hydratase-related protein [Dehalococcoidia bacterium]MDZ4245913.1 enoyl-CoA hydratase-related protein [Dehalococcoidia bacterium]